MYSYNVKAKPITPAKAQRLDEIALFQYRKAS